MGKIERVNASGKQTAERIAVLVLGMHRSGTSALTRVLSLLGCDLPKTLVDPHPSNETGHWESLPIVRLNDGILSSAGSNWHDWLAFNAGWHSSPKAFEFKEKALAALEEEFGRSRLLVLKDPRICRFAPFWLEVLEAAGIRPVIIMPVRNPLEVAASLSTRDGVDPSLGHLLWLRYVLEAEAGSRGLPRFHTTYEHLLTSWPKLAVGAQVQLGISWPRLSALTGEEIDDFLTDRLRHHQESRSNVSDNPLLSAWLRDAFAIFNRWADEGENVEDHAALDRIRAELDAAAPAFARLILAGQQSAHNMKALDAGLADTRSKLAEAEATAAAHQQRVEALEQNLDEALGELSHSRSELAQRHAEADDATAELQKAEQRHAEELDAERASLAARFDEISSLTRLLQDKEAEVAAALESKLDEAERVARLSSELEAERKRASAEAEKLRQEKGAAEVRLAERFSEIAIMTRLLAEKEGEAERADWLREVSAVLLNGTGSTSLKGRLAALLPAQIRLKKQKARLRRNGMFDPDAYIAAHPDVAEAGLDPLWHYINHGMAEGRQLHPAQASKE
jgi:hypothetical protein